MLEKLKVPMVGSSREIASVERSAGCSEPSMSPNQLEAAKQVNRLFSLLPPQDVGDPEAFLSAVIALFSEHAPHVMDKAVIEIAKRSDRPTIRTVAQVLDDIDDRAREREQIANRLPPPRDPPRSPEQQARIDALVADTRRKFGIPPEGLGRKRTGNLQKTG